MYSWSGWYDLNNSVGFVDNLFIQGYYCDVFGNMALIIL